MADDDLRQLLDRLAAENELRRIGIPVDPHLELLEIASRVARLDHGPALLFERVGESTLPVVTNLFATPARCARILGADNMDEAVQRFDKRLALVSNLKSLNPFTSRLVNKAPWQETSLLGTLSQELPFLTRFPEDGAMGKDPSSLTLAVTVTKGPAGDVNWGVYRVTCKGSNRLCLHWHGGSGGHLHWQQWQELDQPMPVALFLGGDPLLTLAAAFSPPPDMDEPTIAGVLAGEALELTPCRLVPLTVPRSADLVLEGWLAPGDLALSGPFGNYSGFYGAPRQVPVMTVVAASRRPDAVVPAMAIGPPPTESSRFAEVLERLYLPVLRQSIPEVVDLQTPAEWLLHGCALLAIRKERAGQGTEVLHRLRQLPRYRRAPLLLVVDGDQSLADRSAIAARAMAVLAQRRGTADSEGGLNLDATLPWIGEAGVTSQPRVVTMTEELSVLVTGRWQEYGL
ncbi:MAG TPA: UbiD family decarboxylase [Geobacterales bacterium]|nr:UbiD family decarboxylase [Geobacterales bacterium]